MNNLEILYEDNHIIVVVKPFNVLSQSDITNDKDMLSIIKEYIKVKYNKPGNVYLGLVHRLDRPTKGIMVFAKTSKAASRLSEQIKEHKFKKGYVAVIHGKPEINKGKFIDYIKKEEKKAIITNPKEGKQAELEYEVLKYNKENNLSLIKINLITGRYNQIRCQFASRKLPLYGDNKYGNIDKKQLCLIANKLEFFHPTTKELLSFEIGYKEMISGFNNF